MHYQCIQLQEPTPARNVLMINTLHRAFDLTCASCIAVK